MSLLIIESIAKKVGVKIEELEICPLCKEKKLFPKHKQAFNSVSMTDNDTLICRDCGERQAIVGRSMKKV
jgi:uncharacterized protein YbaR (Trm112 family)